MKYIIFSSVGIVFTLIGLVLNNTTKNEKARELRAWIMGIGLGFLICSWFM